MAKKQRYYFIDTHSDGEKIAIVEQVTDGVTVDGYTSDYVTVSEVKGLKIRGIFFDADLSAGTLSGTYSNIPSRFHEHIVSRVIATGYFDPRNFDGEKAKLFAIAYETGQKKAKRFSKSNYQTTGKIVHQDF